MLRKLFCLCLFLFLGNSLSAQGEGAIKGRLVSKETKTKLTGAQVEVVLNGVKVAATVTDTAGEFICSPLVPGKYNLLGHAPEMKTTELDGIVVSDLKISYVTVELQRDPAMMSKDEYQRYRKEEQASALALRKEARASEKKARKEERQRRRNRRHQHHR